MDAEDMNGKSGQSLPLCASNAQVAKLKKTLEDRKIIPGKSKLEHGAATFFNEDGQFVPPSLDTENKVRKKQEP